MPRKPLAFRFLLGLACLALCVLLTGAVSRRAVAAPVQNAIQIENAKPGTPGWDDFSSVAQQDAISGYGSKISLNHGDALDLYVTTTAPSFTIDVFRTGWYGGAGARLVAALGTFSGVHQAIPSPDPLTGMVAATAWTKTTTLAVPSAWVTGAYLAKLTASNGNKSFIFFVVRDDGGREPILFQSSVTTSQAYNVWGGLSLYTNEGNRAVYSAAAATKVSFDRPFDPRDGNGAGQFFAYEYPFVRWAESQGYDVSYITDVDTHTNVNPLTNHRAFLSVGHDEYWSKGMRDNVAAAISQGVNVAFFAANSMYWQIRLEQSSLGVPNRVEVGYKDSSTSSTAPGPDPQYGVNNAIVTTRWRDAPVNNPENGLLGVMYQDQVNQNYDYVVQNASNWVYAGSGFANGTHVPGIVGYEYDKVWSNGATPPGLTILSSSPVVGCCEGSGSSTANSTVYTAPSGAQVFASGTIQWSWGLDGYSGNFVNAGIQKTTSNILNAFSMPAGPSPSVSITPASLDFGAPLVGTSSPSQSATVTNTGTGPLTISSIALTGAAAADYSSTGTCPVAPSTLAAGATCQVSLTFTPGAPGSRTAAVTITDDALGSPHTLALSGTGTPRTAVSMPLISRGLPAFASSQVYPASNANDSSYATVWNGSIPSWLAYDLSSVPPAQRGKVVLAWYNDPQTSAFDHRLVGDLAYNNLRDYTIEANAAAGGAAAPSTGWVNLATVAGNGYHSRQHLLDLSGYNWVRISVTASDGSAGNTNAAFNLDLHDASQGAGDSWIFYGDSIVMDGMHHEPINGVGNFSQLINAARPAYYPAYEDGGTGGTGALDGARNIAAWLGVFPGRYVGLSFGTNDANGCGDTTAFYNNYVSMVQAVLAAGKVPVVSTIPWSRTANIRSCGPGFNAKIQALYDAYPQVAKGPDLWAFFQANQSLVSADDLHPSSAGYAAYRQQWANAMIASFYGGSGAAPVVSLAPASLVFGSQSVGSSSVSQSSVLKNTGTAPLTISSVAVAGANAGDYTQTNTCPIAPATLAAGASCTIGVTFSPTTAGSRSASITVSDDAAGSPQALGLSGTGVVPGPAVSLTPASLGFGSQLVGSSSVAQSSVLKNTGTAPLTISGVAVAGANAGDFTSTTDCPLAPATLAVAASCSVSVTFRPSAAGSRSASVAVSDDAAGSPHSIGLSGTGTTPSAVAFDKSLGTKIDNLAGTTLTLTTSAAAVTQSRVFVFVVWNHASQTLTSLSGGGLTWTVDKQLKGTGNNEHAAIASADAPLGLGLGTVLTATFSGSVTHGLIAASSFTGIAPTAPLDSTGGSSQAGVTAWTTTLTTTNPNDLILGFSTIDANATSTPTAPNTEIHDFGDANYYGWATSTYRIDTTTGPKTSNGTWIRATGATGNTTITAAYKGSGGGTPPPPAPAVSITPPSLGFGSQPVGSTSGSQSSVVKNTGTGPLTISSVGVVGANAADFTATSTCPLAPATLAAGATCSVAVTFRPSAAGARSASVSIGDDATGSPQSVGLTGTGAAPAVSLTPASLAFGSQLVGSSSASQSSVLKNTGAAPLTVASVGVVGANAGDFALSSDCPLAPAALAANATCTITLVFSPSAAGGRSASVSVSDDAAGSPQALGLSGTGVVPGPAVSLTPASLGFGSQLVGSSSASQSSVLKNTGTAPLTIGSIASAGANAGDYTQTNTCPLAPATLATGASCTINVTFAPTAAGSRSASVTVSDDAVGSPHSVGLSGTGTTPSAVAFDKSLGTKIDNVAGTTMTLATSAAAVTQSRVFVFVVWNHASQALTSVSGGGLTWTVDKQLKGTGNDEHVAIASAAAPLGLAAGTVVTATFSGSVTHGLIAAASFTGIAPTTPLDSTGGSSQAGVTTWTTSLTTTNPNDLILGFSTIDANATSTPTAPNTEIHDFGDINYYGWATSTYRIDTTTGPKTSNGTWARATGATGNTTITAAYKTG